MSHDPDGVAAAERALASKGVVRRSLSSIAVSTVLDAYFAAARVDRDEAGKARRSDPPTAKRAAEQVRVRSGTQRGRVFDAIVWAGETGMTSEEVSVKTGIPYRSVTPRVGELKRGGWIKASGRTRKSSMNVDTEVLVARESIDPPQEAGPEPSALFDLAVGKCQPEFPS